MSAFRAVPAQFSEHILLAPQSTSGFRIGIHPGSPSSHDGRSVGVDCTVLPVS